jgi:hypothetical protein
MVRRSRLRPCWVAVLCLAACVRASAQSPAPVTWLIFVDDLHLDFRNTGRIRDAIRTISKELVQDGDRFTIASSGPSGLAIGVTTDRQLLDAARKKVTGNALKYHDIVQSPDGAAEARYRVSKAVATAQSVLDNLSRMPAGPKALLYITNGYSFELLPDRPPGSRALGKGLDVTRAEVRAQLDEFTATAARAAVAIFAIAPGFASKDLDAAASDPAWPAHLSAMRGSLESMADTSGGLAIVEGELVTQLRRVADAMRK